MNARFPYIVKESTNTNALHKTTLHASFPSSTSTSALPKAALHFEGNLMHARFPYIVKEIRRSKYHCQCIVNEI